LREFHEVAQLAGQAVRGQNRFERIYLLNALEPGLQAFEIFPALAECRQVGGAAARPFPQPIRKP